MRLPQFEGNKPLYPIIGCFSHPHGEWIRTYEDYLAVRKCRQNYINRWKGQSSGSWRKGVTRLTK